MKDIEELLSRVMEVAPACPEPTAIRHLRDAAIEFCRRTRIWRSSDSWAVTVTDTCEVVAVPAEATLFEITHASVNETDLVPRTLDWLDKNEPGWREHEGPPFWITQSAPGTLRIVPKPESGETATITVEMILVPSQTADRLPDVLIDTYPGVIADGALGRLLALPSDFASDTLAAFHGGKFEDAIGRWSAQIPKGQQRAPRRVKPASQF